MAVGMVIALLTQFWFVVIVLFGNIAVDRDVHILQALGVNIDNVQVGHVVETLLQFVIATAGH